MHRSVLLAVCGGTILSLGGCESAPETWDDVLDARLAGPCQRLILFWPESVSRLRAFIGGGFEPSDINDVGELRLTVLQCGPAPARRPPLRFAFLSVPVSADNVPVVITRMPDDGWTWLPFVIADTDSSAVFAAMGYAIEVAEIGFELDTTEETPSVAAQLRFDSGSISITARFSGQPEPYARRAALVSADADYHSVFFGEETASRHTSISVDFELQGNTPLTVIDARRAPEFAVFDTERRQDRVYWRLPRSEP